MTDLKNSIVLCGSLLMILTLVSCKEHPSPIPSTYLVYLEFKDQNGTNLLNDFDVDNLKTDIVATSEQGEVINTSYSILESDDKKILRIHSSTLPGERLTAITYTIHNEELMGNAEMHTLDTKWLFSNNNNVLTDLYKDGEKLSPVENDFYSYYVLIKE